MGGDYAPRAAVRGVVNALRDSLILEVTLVGDEGQISRELETAEANAIAPRIRIVHTTEVVGMDEAPVEAIKHKRDSSLAKMVELAATGEVDAVLSAGNTGACAAACQLRLRSLPCVSRPGIAVASPSFHGPFVLCDVGANIQAKARHLYEYAVMASLYAQRVLGVDNPRVAMLSIGEESGKGTGLVKEAYALLSADSVLNFVGNVEGRELFLDRCDVAVCDGFVGNIVLKFVEGLAEGLFATIEREFDDEDPQLKERFCRGLDSVRRRHDYSRYGGAPLLGINGVCVICHGRSNEVAVCNAVKAAGRFVEQKFVEAITGRLGKAVHAA